jgi:predicted transcriptional regulator of viral defense system
MRSTKAYAEILRLRRPVMTTGETAALLGVPGYSASRLLRQLAGDGLVVPIRRGLWAVGERPDPAALIPALTAPYPSYVSAWSALSRHGMIDQIPRETYVASLDRSKRIKTSLGTFVVQHLAPALFGGYTTDGGPPMATPEKALFDAVYLALVKGRRFAALPEIELAAEFDEKVLWAWVDRIRSRRLRTLVRERLTRALTVAEYEEPGRAARRTGTHTTTVRV